MSRTVENGWFRFVDYIAIDGDGASPFVIGRAWMIEFVELTSGSMSFISDGRKTVPNSARFGIYYAPFSIIELAIDHACGRVEGFGSVDLGADLPATPALFEPNGLDLNDLDALLNAVRSGTPIPLNSGPSLISIRAKRIIDERYVDDLAIADVAAKVRVSHEHLTRQFRKDYALAPLDYLHKLRMAEASSQISQGAEIIAVSSDVGYNDLGRFYKQFRKAFSTTPGSCK